MNENKVVGRVGSYEFISAQPGELDQTATLKAWLLHLPKQHPVWDRYMLGVIHLRSIEGVEAPYKYAANAEHEILLCALDPHAKPSANDVETLIPLTPINYTVQFAGLTDDQAVKLGSTLATAFIEGGFSAEPQGIVGAEKHFYRKVQSYVISFLPGVKMYTRPFGLGWDVGRVSPRYG